MELLIPGAMLAAGLATLVRVVKFYRQGDILRAVFWLLVFVAFFQIVGPGDPAQWSGRLRLDQ